MQSLPLSPTSWPGYCPLWYLTSDDIFIILPINPFTFLPLPAKGRLCRTGTILFVIGSQHENSLQDARFIKSVCQMVDILPSINTDVSFLGFSLILWNVLNVLRGYKWWHTPAIPALADWGREILSLRVGDFASPRLAWATQWDSASKTNKQNTV